ncbi:MAG: VOC family protein [Deltaproteobacteria bacterium]|nr:VOC family protein [Deltaproteobacteria bacterium]MBW2120332.1 VOC family protein [Deltaproteobacteria bacterium]
MFQSQITLLYFRNIEKAYRFFEEILRLKVRIDQGYGRIYEVAGNALIGVMDERRGFLQSGSGKSVMISLVTEDVDEWYEELRKKGVKLLSSPLTKKEIGIRSFLFEDPEGHVLEIQKFTGQDPRPDST